MKTGVWQVLPPGLKVTLYPVMAEPRVVDAVQEVVTVPFEPDAVTAVGAFGTSRGVTLLVADDAVLLPAALMAITVKVYAWFQVKVVI